MVLLWDLLESNFSNIWTCQNVVKMPGICSRKQTLKTTILLTQYLREKNEEKDDADISTWLQSLC